MAAANSDFGVRKLGPPILGAERVGCVLSHVFLATEFLASEPQYLHLQNETVFRAVRWGEIRVCLVCAHWQLTVPPDCPGLLPGPVCIMRARDGTQGLSE